MKVTDKATGAVSDQDVTITKDEGNRPDTTLEGLAALKTGHAGRDDHRRQRQPAVRRLGRLRA